jgi:hypothetical protein
MGYDIIAMSRDSGYVSHQTDYLSEINKAIGDNSVDEEKSNYNLNSSNSNKLFDTAISENDSNLIIYH